MSDNVQVPTESINIEKAAAAVADAEPKFTSYQSFDQLISDQAKTTRVFTERIIREVCEQLGHADRAYEMIEIFVNSKTIGKLKVSKTRDGPTRALSAYLIFSSEMRPKLAVENPSLDGKSILSVLGKRWKDLSEEEKQPYRAKAVEDQERFKDQLETFRNKKSGVMNMTNAV